MRISVTADVHLRTRAEHSERYNALENIFEQTITEGIENLLIAGDLFDKDFRSYSEFEELGKQRGRVFILDNLVSRPSRRMAGRPTHFTN